jgi:hypothetical protein
LFKKDPSFDDIQQGGIGDCYFCAAAASLAEFPWAVRAAFINTKVNKCGIYGVIFNIGGEPKPVILDDFFMHNDRKDSCFLQFKNGKIWATLMEKAWAKTVGSYERIVGGLCVDAFGTFTGLPSRSFYHRDNDCD